jgi:uncharacterized protein YeaO (DUF488 family)
MKENALKIKRVYLPAEEGDGYRILIDRLWPRGLSRDKAELDEWCKDIAPTALLRKWFGHKEENYAEFAENYRKELDDNADSLSFARHCASLLKEGDVTLLYGAKNATCNHALILQDWIKQHCGK